MQNPNGNINFINQFCNVKRFCIVLTSSVIENASPVNCFVRVKALESFLLRVKLG